MPVSYQIDTARRTIFWKFEGSVTDREVIEAVRLLDADPDYRPEYARLIEAFGAHFADLTGKCLRRVARRTPGAPVGKTAMVADSDAAYGMGRVFQAYMEDVPCQVFRNRSEAMTWLGIGGASTAAG